MSQLPKSVATDNKCKHVTTTLVPHVLVCVCVCVCVRVRVYVYACQVRLVLYRS